MSDDNLFEDSKNDIIKLIIEQSKHRHIVPFLGSGISVSSGFPSISPIIQYLAKVIFAIHFGVYKDRFPPFKEGKEGKIKLLAHYKQHPSEFLKDFGWPNFGTIDADLWKWLNEEKEVKNYESIKNIAPKLINDFDELDKRDHLLALVQWVLRDEQSKRDDGTQIGNEGQWKRWKDWRKSDGGDEGPKLLYGDWENLLDKLCEGELGLIDQLFSAFEKGLTPSKGHRLLAFLQPKLGIPLVLTTNFDSLLERAFHEQGITPKVFDVHRTAQLPDPALVKNQLSVLKLHGSAYGLRLGESLRYKLEMDAKSYTRRYLPENALILVIGFSGSERRMMQMLQAISENGKDNPRIIWIQGPGSTGSFVKELFNSANHKKKKEKNVRGCVVKHADTFLEELYFKLTYSHQAALKSYITLPGQQPEIELSLEFKSKIKHAQKPVQVFCCAKEDISGSWAALAGLVFTKKLYQGYRVVWIDLENHSTVESVIAEFFARVRLIDPISPHFNFYLSNTDQNKASMGKLVDRICEVFQRGRFVLVLDSLEAFGRQPMVHHGVSNINGALLKDFKKQLGLILAFFKALVNRRVEDFTDSYVVFTIDTPRKRHLSADSPHSAFDKLKKIISVIGGYAKAKGSIVNLNLKENPELQIYYRSNEVPDKKPLEIKSDQISDCWKTSDEDPQKNHSIGRAENVWRLLTYLRNPNNGINEIDDEKNIVSAFVGLLSFFRRPRPIPLLRTFMVRWGHRKIGDKQLSEIEGVKSHQVIDHLIKLITLSGNPSDQEKLSYGTIAQYLEGGGIWLFREIHDDTYNAITQLLHIQDWVDIDINPSSDLDRKFSAILDGMVCISWHLQAARTYYVDIFMPTRDIQAFYEYLYHRVSALRTITLLIAIIVSFKNNPIGEREKSINFDPENKHFNSPLLWLADQIGVFSEDPSYKADSNIEESEAVSYFLEQLLSLRENALETLYKALMRNKHIFMAYSIPEIVMSWSEQFITQEIRTLNGEIFNNSALQETLKKKLSSEDCSVTKLTSFFEDLLFKSRLSKFDFEGIIQKECASKNLKNLLNEALPDIEKKEGLEKKDFERYANLLRCSINLSPKLTKESIDSFNKNLPKVTTPPKFQRDLQALHAKSILATWSIWVPLRKRREFNPREMDIKYPKDIKSFGVSKPLKDFKAIKALKDHQDFKALSESEKYAIAYEDSLRITCERKEEETRHRSNAFGIRARSLYLRRHFRQGHRFIDLASSNLELGRVDHSTNAGMIHTIRAELLAISADYHFRRKLLIPSDPAEISLILNKEVHVSLKKIERAEQELNLANELFVNLAHHKDWMLFMEFGMAQLRFERMLFEMESLLHAWPVINENEYLKRSGELEKNILFGMSRLRNVLEMIPFRTETWKKTLANIKKLTGEMPEPGQYPMLIKYERMCYQLWLEMFVAGAFFHSLLDGLYKNHVHRESTHLRYKIDHIRCNIFNSDNRFHFIARWKSWSISMRFNKLQNSVDLDWFSCPPTDQNETTDQLIRHSIREYVIEITQEKCKEEKINDLWDKRRA